MNKKIVSEHDIYLFHQGTLHHSYHLMGAHLMVYNGERGVRFTVWAPSARGVSIVGNFNDWVGDNHQMSRINNTGIWFLFVPGLQKGDIYKYRIVSKDGQVLLKADPYAFYSELRPRSASVIYPLDKYNWDDSKWQNSKTEIYDQPLNIYELHPGTWKKKEDGAFLNYRELARELVPYVKEMGYTHIEIMPINEHPFDRSWGYQSTGYYSVTSRYGEPDDFKFLVDHCHQQGIGVILDWVPGHFCKDGHGLIQFDGTKLYEYSESWKAEKVEWGTLTFNFGRNEVQSFLISNAVFWFDVYHIDGIRVDAVASMLHLDDGQVNDDAVYFIKKLNETVFKYYPDSLMIAEESSTWPLVTSPTSEGGLGFNYKWNMGWMNDMLEYMEKDPIHRKYHHNLITFSIFYAFTENFILPLSHDEVVYGKKSLLNKMPGDYWQKFANLRVFLGYMMTHPGKKLLFMGGEFGQFDEWKDLEHLDWFLLDYEMHAKCKEYVCQLNNFYLKTPALWEKDHEPDGFEWIDANNSQQSIISFIRRGEKEGDLLLIVCNFTPEYYQDFKIGVPENSGYCEIFNSDLNQFGGSNKSNEGIYRAVKGECHNLQYSINIKIPPLAIIIFRKEDSTQQIGNT